MKIKVLLLLMATLLSGFSADMLAQRKVLVVYFSHSGNTRAVANYICKQTNGDIFEIKTVKPYPTDYQTVVDIAKKEQNSDFRPAIQPFAKDIRQYDVVFIGYPNWWGTYPQAVKVFLSQYNLSGKTILPFCTHEGSALGRSVDDLKKMCPKAIIGEGLAIRGSKAHEAGDVINAWLRKLKISK